MFKQISLSTVAGVGKTTMSRNIVFWGIATSVAMGVSFINQSDAYAISGFQGDYAPSNWTFTNTNADGSVNTSSAPSSITLTGGDLGGGSGTTDYTIAAVGDGTVSFDWDYSTTDVDGPSFDPFNFLFNGVQTQLTDDGGANTQNSTANFSVSTGDTFGFQIFTTDNGAGAGVVTISNFSAPDPTAVPFELSPTLGLLMVGGIWGVNRLRKNRKPLVK